MHKIWIDLSNCQAESLWEIPIWIKLNKFKIKSKEDLKLVETLNNSTLELNLQQKNSTSLVQQWQVY